MSYQQMWRAAKDQYTTAVNAKKPSPKFLAFFKKSTGISPACHALDEALAAGNTAAALKALQDLKTKGENYMKVLAKEAAGDPGARGVNSSALAAALKNIIEDATKKVTKSGNPTVVQAIGADAFNKVSQVTAGDNDHVKKFLNDADFRHNYATGQAGDAALKAFQDSAKAANAQFQSAKNAFLGLRGKTMPRDHAAPFCIEALNKMRHLLVNGIHGQIIAWHHHQENTATHAGAQNLQDYRDSLEFQLAHEALEHIDDDIDILAEAIIDLGGHPA